MLTQISYIQLQKESIIDNRQHTLVKTFYMVLIMSCLGNKHGMKKTRLHSPLLHYRLDG